MGEIEIYVKVMAVGDIGFDCNHQGRWSRLGGEVTANFKTIKFHQTS